jgi:hypothetical protein
MRTQYCRIKIVEGAGEKCDVSPDTISDLKKVLKFVENHPDLEGLATKPIKALMKIPNPDERDKAISTVEKALKSKKSPSTGKFTKRVTESDILKTMEKVAPSAVPPTPQPKNNAGNYQPGDLKESGLPPQPSLAAQMKAKDDGFFIPTTPDPAKAKSARMEELAVELLSMYSPTFQTMVNEIVRVRNTPTSHYGVKDAFYFGVQALAEKKP